MTIDLATNLGADSWDCGDFQGDCGPATGGAGLLRKAVLLTGPPGVGKTASVYACARELGFKVFEVNCSSRRSGRSVLSQLKEATQSHLVEVSPGGGGAQPPKPVYFHSHSDAEAPPGNTAQPKKVPSWSNRKTARSGRASGRKPKVKPNTLTLAHFFKMKRKADVLHFGGVSENPQGAGLVAASPGCAPRSRKTATSLILFEEVDVVFEEDVGFLGAVRAFMATTKRPVILTTHDPSFRRKLDRDVEEIVFRTPSAVNACAYLQLACLAEGARLDSDDVSELFRLTRGDVRRCLLQLELWVRTGGGAPQTRRSPEEPVCPPSVPQRPPPQTFCSASMLGLHHLSPDYLLNFLKRGSWSETDTKELLSLLAESWRGDVPLLYLNLEFLLSLGLEGRSDRCPETEPQTSHCGLHVHQKNPADGPDEVVTLSKPVRSISRLSRRKLITAASGPRPEGASPRVSGTRPRPQTGRAGTTGSLDALADIFDLMSFLDATLTDVSGSPTPEAFVWTGAALKDGLLDETSEEDRGTGQERVVEVKAAVEGLGHHIFWGRVSEAWTAAPNCPEEVEDKPRRDLTDRRLTSSSGRRSLSLSLRPPSGSQRRYKLSRAVLSSPVFGLLGNRRAVFVDYVPALRSIRRALDARRQKEPARCVDHLSSSGLGLPSWAVKLLAGDFPPKPDSLLLS